MSIEQSVLDELLAASAAKKAAQRERSNRYRSKPDAREKQREYSNEYYKNNHLKQKAYYTNKVRNNKTKMLEYKGHKCLDCGGQFHPVAMDFHHRDGTEKSDSLAYLKKMIDWDRIKAELDKCDLLCSNCHRIRHHAESWDKEINHAED